MRSFLDYDHTFSLKFNESFVIKIEYHYHRISLKLGAFDLISHNRNFGPVNRFLNHIHARNFLFKAPPIWSIFQWKESLFLAPKLRLCEIRLTAPVISLRREATILNPARLLLQLCFVSAYVLWSGSICQHGGQHVFQALHLEPHYRFRLGQSGTRLVLLVVSLL